MLISIDPGLRHCTAAFFENKKLIRTLWVDNPQKKLRGPKAWVDMAGELSYQVALAKQFSTVERLTVVLEMQQVYGGRFAKDLIELASVTGAIAHCFSGDTLVGYLPKEWTRGRKKPVHNEHTLKALTSEELKRLAQVAKSLQHNIIDAVGIGLYHLGRL